MLKIGSKSILKWQLESIPIEHISELIIIVGHERDQIKREIENLNLSYNVKFIFNDFYKECNCGYSFSLTKDMIKGPIIYINSDLIVKQYDLIRFFNDSHNESLLVNIGASKHDDFLKGDIKRNNEMIYWPEHGYGENGNCIIVGPFKMTEDTHRLICDEFESLADQTKKQISCYGLFSKALPYKKFYGINVLLQNFWEIDTFEDIIKAREILGQTEEF